MAKGIIRLLVPDPSNHANPGVTPVMGQIIETDDQFNIPSGPPKLYTFQLPEGLKSNNEHPEVWTPNVTKVQFEKSAHGNTSFSVERVG